MQSSMARIRSDFLIQAENNMALLGHVSLGYQPLEWTVLAALRIATRGAFCLGAG